MDKHINLVAHTYYILYCDSDYRRWGRGGVATPCPSKKSTHVFAEIYVSLLAWDLLAIKLTLNVCTHISSNNNILHQLHRYNVSVLKLNTIIYIYGCQTHEYLASGWLECVVGTTPTTYWRRRACRHLIGQPVYLDSPTILVVMWSNLIGLYSWLQQYNSL